MKPNLNNRDVERFTRSLIKNFGRKGSRELLHLLQDKLKGKNLNEKDSLLTGALGELDKRTKVQKAE